MSTYFLPNNFESWKVSLALACSTLLLSECSANLRRVKFMFIATVHTTFSRPYEKVINYPDLIMFSTSSSGNMFLKLHF